MLRLLLHFLFHLSIHLPVSFFLLALPPGVLVLFAFAFFVRSLNASLLQPSFILCCFFLCTTTHSCYSRASPESACVLICTCAGHKGVVVSAKQSTNTFFFVSSSQPIYSFSMPKGVYWCDVSHKRFGSTLDSFSPAPFWCLAFVAMLRLCSCPCWKSNVSSSEVLRGCYQAWAGAYTSLALHVLSFCRLFFLFSFFLFFF